MGALVSGVCYPDASAAADALFGSTGPEILDYLGAPALSFMHQVNGTWQLALVQSGVLVQSSAVPVPVFLECDPGAAFLDGVQLGFSIGLVWLVAWGFTVMRQPMI